MDNNLVRRLAAEFLGTSMLLAAIVGSGIMAERLSAGNVALALLANAVATGAALFALILTFAPVSGAHFNPVVSLSGSITGSLSRRDTLAYILVQLAGAVFGVAVANLMFDLPAFFASTKARTGASQWLGEFVATYGLVTVIVLCSRLQKSVVPAFAVAAYITAAYWFTSSTSFANPAVTVARALSDTFAGIRPQDVPFFILAQFAGALAATYVCRWLAPPASEDRPEVRS